MFKFAVVVLMTIAAASAKPGVVAPVAYSAPLAYAPSYVTSQSSQVIARNYNGVAPVVAAYTAPIAAAYTAPIAAAYTAPIAAAYSAPLTAAAYTAPIAAAYSAPLTAAAYASPFAAPYYARSAYAPLAAAAYSTAPLYL